jgi:hypothetical protein
VDARGSPTEDSLQSSGRRVSVWPQWCSGGPDVSELSVWSSAAGAIADANARPCRAARRSRPFATPATPWRVGPKTVDRSYEGADARPCVGEPTTADAAPRSRARRLGDHYRAARTFEAKRQALPACAILSSNRSENQPVGLAIRFWRATAWFRPFCCELLRADQCCRALLKSFDDGILRLAD